MSTHLYSNDEKTTRANETGSKQSRQVCFCCFIDGRGRQRSSLRRAAAAGGEKGLGGSSSCDVSGAAICLPVCACCTGAEGLHSKCRQADTPQHSHPVVPARPDVTGRGRAQEVISDGGETHGGFFFTSSSSSNLLKKKVRICLGGNLIICSQP